MTKLSNFWYSIPGTRSALGRLLRTYLDRNTEVNPRCDGDFPQHLTSILLKLTLLNEVFIDRDYSDKDKQCVVPFMWENFMRIVIEQLAPLSLSELKVYGGMYPTIIESILVSSPFLTSLSISHINITNDLILAISYSCPCLQQLYLMHCFPWQVMSMSVFCTAFFNGASENEVRKAMRSDNPEDAIDVTFNHLTDIELCYGHIEVAKNFHRYLLYFYKNLSVRFSEWRSCLFEEGYGAYAQDIVFPLVLKGSSLYIEQLFLDAITISNTKDKHIRYLAWSCPLIKEIKLESNLKNMSPTSSLIKQTSQKLELFARESQSISSLHINVSNNLKTTLETIIPMAKCRGTHISSLTLEASVPGENIYPETLTSILEVCPNIKILKIRVWSKTMIHPSFRNFKSDILNNLKLEEFWLHEEAMGYDNEDDGTICLWKTLLKLILSNSPNLYTLSLSISNDLSSLLNELVSYVSCLHVFIKNGFEWQPNVKDIYNLVNRQKNLEHIFLEDFSGKNFWKIKHHYSKSSLNVHWGNLSGWPRS